MSVCLSLLGPVLELFLTLPHFPQSAHSVRRTMVAVPTCAYCPRGSLSTHAPAPLACSFRTTARRARQVRLRAPAGHPGGTGSLPVPSPWGLRAIITPVEIQAENASLMSVFIAQSSVDFLPHTPVFPLLSVFYDLFIAPFNFQALGTSDSYYGYFLTTCHPSSVAVSEPLYFQVSGAGSVLPGSETARVRASACPQGWQVLASEGTGESGHEAAAPGPAVTWGVQRAGRGLLGGLACAVGPTG